MRYRQVLGDKPRTVGGANGRQAFQGASPYNPDEPFQLGETLMELDYGQLSPDADNGGVLVGGKRGRTVLPQRRFHPPQGRQRHRYDGSALTAVRAGPPDRTARTHHKTSKQ